MVPYVPMQLVYWGQVTAAGAISIQAGPGALTIGLAASVYTLTMPANFTIPINRRYIDVSPTGAVDLLALYNEAASAANTVVVNGFTANTGAATNSGFQFCFYRVETQIGGGAG